MFEKWYDKLLSTQYIDKDGRYRATNEESTLLYERYMYYMLVVLCALML